MKQFVIGLVVFLIILGASLMGTYNGLVTQSNSVDGQWAQVETVYQRRLDLIPNLVASAKGFMAQEKEVFTAIADARTRYSSAVTPSDKAQSATAVESSLARLLVIMENYPQLKSDQTVLRLMDELAGTENRVNVERRRYNELVQSYNTKIKTVPTNIIASLFGFSLKNYFEADETAKQAPKVEF